MSTPDTEKTRDVATGGWLLCVFVLVATGSALHLWSVWLVLTTPAELPGWLHTLVVLVALMLPGIAEVALLLANWSWSPGFMGAAYTPILFSWLAVAAAWHVATVMMKKALDG